MPANVVKTAEDERFWRKAKDLAEKQGRAGDYAYIMGIFKRMTGKSMTKGFVIPWSRGGRIPGQVPDRETLKALRALEVKPPPLTPEVRMRITAPQPTAQAVVSNLGLPLADMVKWSNFLEDIVSTSVNEVTLRKALYDKMLEERFDPALRKALYEKAMIYYRSKLGKAVAVVTPDQLLQKAEARGGSYHKRIPKPGGGFRYIYDPEKYDSREDAHVNGVDARKAYIKSRVCRHIEKAGEAGCDVESMKGLARVHGVKEVAEVLQAGDGFVFKKGRFYPVTQPKAEASVKKPLEEKKKLGKSLRPRFTIQPK